MAGYTKMTTVKLKKKSLIPQLIAAGLILNLGMSISYAEEVAVTAETDAVSLEEKIQLRLAEIAAEARAADRAKNGYYVERKSYGTKRETEPPGYVKQANKTWLKDYDAFENLNWLDIGLDYRIRAEKRDNDFRRNSDTSDEPILLRTRAFVAVKDIFDPLRFTLEVEDAHRVNSQFSNAYDKRDFNRVEPIQAYLELYFKDNFLGKDDLGNERIISVKAGRQAFEYLDRRLFARNEWRNTTNNHQGIRATFGQQKNDWQLDILALKPVTRFQNDLDKVNHSQDIYGAIFDWRRWSDVATLQPYYYVFKQDGEKVRFTTNGAAESQANKIDRTIHTAGLRAFGIIGKTGFDYDASYIKQWGNQDVSGTDSRNLDHDAYAYNAEIGYSPKHSWKPRFSAFYGFASGDKTSGFGDGKNQRFDASFGFARPWSNNDYFDMANISAPKVRVEFEPQVSWLDSVKVDTGFSWYRLDSATDRWRGAELRDSTGQSGKDVGKEVDLRVRFPINKYIGVNLGYAHFWAGEFTKTQSQRSPNQDRRDNSDFLYAEFAISAF